MSILFLLRVLGWIKGGFSALASLVVRYPSQCACIAIALFWAWEHHERRVAERVLPVWQAAFHTEQAAFQGSQRNFHGALAAITSQNASIAIAQAQGVAAHAAQQRALGRAVASDAQRAADQAAFTRAALMEATAGSCATSPLIIDREKTL